MRWGMKLRSPGRIGLQHGPSQPSSAVETRGESRRCGPLAAVGRGRRVSSMQRHSYEAPSSTRREGDADLRRPHVLDQLDRQIQISGSPVQTGEEGLRAAGRRSKSLDRTLGRPRTRGTRMRGHHLLSGTDPSRPVVALSHGCTVLLIVGLAQVITESAGQLQLACRVFVTNRAKSSAAFTDGE